MDKLTAKIKAEFLKQSVTKQLPLCNNPREQLCFLIPLSNIDYVAKHPNTDLERYYLEQIVKTLKIREAEELFKLLLPKLKKGNSRRFFSGGSKGIFVPLLEYDYQLPEDVTYSVEVSFPEMGSVDIDTGKVCGEKYIKINVGVGGR